MSSFVHNLIKYGVPPWGAPMPTGGGGGSVATDTIFDVKGDLPVGTGANTAARLAAGTNGFVLIADSTQATGLKWGAAPAGTPAVSVVSETAFGQASAVGVSTNYAKQDHTHGTPTDPVIAHLAAGDPHPQYATDTDLSNHISAPDPHPQYALDSDLSTHVAAADPHTGYQLKSAKDASGGYAGLTLYKINFQNAANTFTSFLTNSNTGARTYTFPDATGTIALFSDITKANVGLSNADNTADAVKSVADSVLWAGSALTISAAAPSGGADGDIWFQY